MLRVAKILSAQLIPFIRFDESLTTIRKNTKAPKSLARKNLIHIKKNFLTRRRF